MIVIGFMYCALSRRYTPSCYAVSIARQPAHAGGREARLIINHPFNMRPAPLVGIGCESFRRSSGSDGIEGGWSLISCASSFHGRFVAKLQSRVARPTRGIAQDRGVLEKYVEGLSDEPVGLATFGSGQACRSSGSAITAEPSCAFEAGHLGKHNRSERKS